MDNKIDFVILWVDGGDVDWQKDKAKYSPSKNTDTRDERYRDWDNLQYWFRGVEKFAPWVNKVHFVTWGHLPSWLNTSHPKLNIVNHKDFIEEKYLPVFSSHPIEINIHKIKGLEEQFVYFNDDMFLIKNAKPEDFFKNGLPCDSAILTARCNLRSEAIFNICFNCDGIINEHFSFKKAIFKDLLKWVNFKYGIISIIRSMILFPCPRFPGFWSHHVSSSFLKTTFEKVWQLEEEILNETSSHKFRDKNDVSQYLFKQWQLASGNFCVRKKSYSKTFSLENGNTELLKLVDTIKNQKCKQICFHDCELTLEQFEQCKKQVNNAFDKILNTKSSFEM